MCAKVVQTIAFVICAGLPLFASGLSGKVTFDKNLSKKTVPAAVYDLRGTAVSGKVTTHRESSEFARVALWLESESAPAAAPVVATMQQRNRHFDPELLVIPVESSVAFPNVDPIFHNIFSLSRTHPFDLGYYAEGGTRTVKFSKPGVVQVYCHVHPDMHGVIVVVPTPWSGKPGQDGTFSWPDVPPGKYKLHVWQPVIGVVQRSVVIPPAGDARVNIALPDEDSGQ